MNISAQRPALLGAPEADDPDELLNRLLGDLEYDATILASVALAALREARFGDDMPALCAAIKTARSLVISMAQTFNKIERAR